MGEEQRTKQQQKVSAQSSDAERRSGADRRSGMDRRLAGTAVKQYPMDRYVFREGEHGDQAFIVKEGHVEIIKRATGKDVPLGVLGAGEMFGEMALIDNEQRMASARVVGGPATLYAISKEQFDSQLANASPFIRKLLKILAGNVRATSRKLSE